jgi:pyrroline-5-carboxylate reductase
MARSDLPLAIVGGGHMGQALVRGALDAGVLEPGLVAVLEPERPKRDMFKAWGLETPPNAADLFHWLEDEEDDLQKHGQVLLAVKPQSLLEVGAELAPLLGKKNRVVISLLAGTPTTAIRRALGGHVCVIRTMSNTPAQIRRATTAIALGEGANAEDAQLATDLFGALGRVVPISEDLMDAFTAVAGSGPAYLFYLAEAMTRAAAEIGFDPDTAQWIVRWTLAGSAALLDHTDQPPATLRAAVTSKGGTTAAATKVLDDTGVMEAFVRAIRAARDRGREMGSGS